MRRRIRQQTERLEKWIFVGFSLHASKRVDLFSVWKMDNSEVGEKKGEKDDFLLPLTPPPPTPTLSDTEEKWASGCKRLQL